MNTQPNIRKIALYGIGAILLVALLLYAWHYLHTGKIIITTDNPNNAISLTKLSDEDGKNAKPQSYKAHTKLSVTASTGQYIVSVEGNSIATTQIITLRSRKTLEYTINPINTTGVEPVIYRNAQNIVADARQIAYLDADAGYLYKIDAQNSPTIINPNQPLRRVKWFDTSFAVAQDNNRRLHTMTNGSVNPLNVPFSYSDVSEDFDVSPSKQIYVSNGADIYLGSQNGDFKKIYTAITTNPAITAGVNSVAVVDSYAGSKHKPLLTIISTSGKVFKKEIESGALAWSPNGQYLLVADESGADIYDNSLHKIVTVPAVSATGHVQWLDNNTIFYSSNDQLWIYKLDAQKSELLANMPLANPITGMALSADKSYIYLTTMDSTSSVNAAIRRVGLKGQKTPDYIYSLQSILPLNLDAFSLNLVNFNPSRPTIIVQPFGDNSVTPPTYLQAAKTELQQRGFDISKLQFILNPAKID
jgi:hypothetical protein